MQIQQKITDKMTESLSPVYLDVVNESHMHSVPANSETHFKLVVVSDSFTGLRPVQRHQKVYGLLADEMRNGVHALALHTFTPAEWDAAEVPDSPQCMGGSKADKV